MMQRLSLCACVFFALFSFTHAQTDEFNVNFTVVTDDPNPPTAPSSLVATPVASSQIDLSWGASIDDVAIGGYQVFRDALQIATTTLTTYSDTGLSANTTYTYHVTAFDTAFNYSSSSNSSATTTLQSAPTSTPPTTDGDGNGSMVKLVSLDIEPGVHAADLSWETNRYAQFVLRWGRTTAYELGFVSNEVYRREHTTRISDLEPSATYEYELVAYDRDGRRFVLSAGQFITLDIPDTTAPSNVLDLQAVVKGKDVALTWKAPSDTDFSYVRILRSYLFYPIDPYDGFIAYQGTGSEFFDGNALASKDVQYYTVFSYDKNGNISSGATVRVSLGGGAPAHEVGTSSELSSLSFADLEVVQDGVRIYNGRIDGGKPTTVRIPYEKLPEHLKALVVTFTHPQNTAHSFSFLLRINKDKSYYEATIGELADIGIYPVTLTVFDYEIKLIQQVSGSYEVYLTDPVSSPIGAFITKDTERSLIFFAWFLLLLLLLLLLLRFLYKAITAKQRSSVTASIAGTFTVLLLLSASVIVYLEDLESASQASLLPTATGDAGTVISLSVYALAAAAAGILLYLLFRKK